MKILVSGSTGLIGSALVSRLRLNGDDVVRLVRPQTSADGSSVSWDPTTGSIDRAELEGFDTVVHLAGENISARRWSRAQKERIRSSRIDDTLLLCSTLASLEAPPKSCSLGRRWDSTETAVRRHYSRNSSRATISSNRSPGSGRRRRWARRRRASAS